jgi:hypothetical protein
VTTSGWRHRSRRFEAPQAAPKPAKKAKATKVAKAATDAPTTAPDAKTPKAAREGTAKARVIAMLQRKGGATLQEIVAETGWQTGIEITSTRRESDQARVYEAAKAMRSR